MRGDEARAASLAEAAVELQPANPEALSLHGRLVWETRQTVGQTAGPTAHPTASYSVGGAGNDGNDGWGVAGGGGGGAAATARMALEQAAAALPGDGRAAFNLALLLHRGAGRPRESEAWYRRAIRLAEAATADARAVDAAAGAPVAAVEAAGGGGGAREGNERLVEVGSGKRERLDEALGQTAGGTGSGPGPRAAAAAGGVGRWDSEGVLRAAQANLASLLFRAGLNSTESELLCVRLALSLSLSLSYKFTHTHTQH